MSTYRVIEVGPSGALRPSERPLVEPAPGHVRIRVQACGICHTDSVAVHEHPESEEGRVPGHEVVGIIDALGANVSRWAVGDRVGVGFLGGHCGICDHCRRGNFVACTDQPQTGVTVDGGYAEVLYARASGLAAIPAELTSQEAAPLLCAGFTTFNALLKGKAAAGDLVAVQGIGGLGHLGIQYGVKMGLRVAAVARGSAKRELALQLGAHHYIDAAATNSGDELKELGGAEVIIATAASGSSMTPLLGGLAAGGRLVVVGASTEPLSVTPLELIFRDVNIGGSLTGSSIENEDNLEFAAAQGIRALIEPARLEDAANAYERMMNGDARFRMVLNVDDTPLP
ncbi:alcohol dehydrogenase catalytic domain-containing protein [Nocardia sp. NPDC049220]|uniref:alcohol dehydrogenase catalytic domain-containing protein n=1 Tax=Nocardia sp. NPDC049220 TaxID=3155273 RepID=UPI003400CE6A